MVAPIRWHPAAVDSTARSCLQEDGLGPDLAEARRLAIADAVPLFLPAIPFGFVLGLAISESPVPDAVGFASSPLIMAGAAQLALISLLGSASLWAAMAAALVINTRHLMYSAAMAPIFRPQPRWFRWAAPMMLIDQVFALASQHSDSDPAFFRRYYGIVAGIFYSGWIVVTALGMAFGSFIPESWQLGYAPAVMFAGLVTFGLTSRPGVVAAVVGASVCFATIGLPNRVGLLIGALCGVLAGFVAETVAERISAQVAPAP